MKSITHIAVAVLMAVVAAGCSNNSTTTTTSPSTTSPSTMVFASELPVRGSAARSFTTTTAGTVTVTLTALGNGTVTAGIGIGVGASGAPCSLAQSVVTAAGSSPQLTASADQGTYCVQVFDPGSLTNDTNFSVTVQYP